jgi:hypothetical protein
MSIAMSWQVRGRETAPNATVAKWPIQALPRIPIFVYNRSMESVMCSVKDIETADRQALEHVLGRPLGDDQQLVIQVVRGDASKTHAAAASPPVMLPDWCNVYEGLSDEQLAALEAVVLTRADLTRDAE